MSRIMVLVSIALALCPLACTVYAQEPNIPSEVQKVAQQGLEMCRGLVGPKATLFGFADGEQVSKVTLGPGYQVHYVDWEKLQSASGDSLLGLCVPVEAWRYVINVDGAPKGYELVAVEEGQ